MVTEHLNLFW